MLNQANLLPYINWSRECWIKLKSSLKRSKRSEEEGQKIQWAKEKGQKIICKTLHTKVKMEQHELY